MSLSQTVGKQLAKEEIIFTDVMRRHVMWQLPLRENADRTVDILILF